MPPAEVLDTPRVLAIRTEPAALAPGEPHTLEALAFGVEAPLVWSACPVAWRPTDPPSCPDDQALTLGQGNPLSVTLPSDLTSLWLRAEPVDGAALPAVKRLEADTEAENPRVSAITTADGRPPTSATIDEAIELAVGLEGDVDGSGLVVSWFVTAGRLEPARTLASERATLVPDAPGPLDVIAIVPAPSGGVGWASAPREVGP